MTDRSDEKPTDLLDRAIAELRDAPIPDGPPPHLLASTVEALQTSMIRPDVVRLRERRRKMLRIARYSGAAAAVVFLAVLAGWLFLMDRTASLAFADVVENVKKAKSVTFVTKMPSIVQGKERGILQQKFYIQADAYRMELPSAQEGVPVPPDAPPILMAVIADVKQKKALQLDFTRKTAKYLKADDKTSEEMAKAFANPIEQLRQLKGDDAERLGEEELNGRKTEVYRLKKTDIFMGMRLTGGETAKLWVDPKSNLPVRIAVEPSADSSDKTPLFVFEQFSFNESLDPDLFKLDVPKGFSIEEE
jgi:outer membrane lipoprotein-sorting protein